MGAIDTTMVPRSAKAIVELAASRIAITDDQLEAVLENMNEECVTEAWQLPHLESFDWHTLCAPVGLVASVRAFMKEYPMPEPSDIGTTGLDNCEAVHQESKHEDVFDVNEDDLLSDVESDLKSAPIASSVKFNKRMTRNQISDLSIDLSLGADDMRILQESFNELLGQDDQIAKKIGSRRASLLFNKHLPDFACIKPERKISREVLLHDSFSRGSFSPKQNNSKSQVNASWPRHSAPSKLTKGELRTPRSMRNSVVRNAAPKTAQNLLLQYMEGRSESPKRQGTADSEAVAEVPLAVTDSEDSQVDGSIEQSNANDEQSTFVEEYEEYEHEVPYNDEVLTTPKRIAARKQNAKTSRVKLAEAFQILLQNHEGFGELVGMEDKAKPPVAQTA